MAKFVFGRVGNIVGKGENAGYKHFLLSHNENSRSLVQSLGSADTLSED